MASKITLCIGASLFTIFCGLQFNDVVQYGNFDAWIWILLYGSMAVLNVAVFIKQIREKVLFAWAGFCWGCLLFRLQDSQGNLHLNWLHPANYWNANGNMVQHSNESGGLLILAIWASLTIILHRQRRKTA